MSNFLGKTESFELTFANDIIVRGRLYDERTEIDVPSGMNVYYIRHEDNDSGIPATLEKNKVFVNYFGLFITSQNLDNLFGDKNYIDIVDWDYTEN